MLVHTVRWASQGNLNLYWNHFSGISGIVITVSMLLVCIPMIWLKQTMCYEIRKYLHYFFVVMAIALCFHSTTASFPNGGFSAWIFSILIVWYVVDCFVVYLFMTEKIQTTVFCVSATGVQLTMSVSERFQRKRQSGGYCYVNFPWIDKYQWHAFSLHENPTKPEERQIYIHVLGDWTKRVHDALQRDTVRPVWVQGPFSSPYDRADEFDNHILVAGGTGITPALSVMRAHQTTRCSNLIWAVRDPHMLEFFLAHGAFSSRGWNLIFYTGKDPLFIGDSTKHVTTSGATVHIIQSRPDVKKLIPNIIYSVEKLSGPFDIEVQSDAIDDLNERLYKDDAGMKSDAGDDEVDKCTFKPWEAESSYSDTYVKSLCHEQVVATWGVLYCGGGPMADVTKMVSKKYNISVALESFEW